MQAVPNPGAHPARASGVAGPATGEQVAEILRPYLDASFADFTFAKSEAPTLDAIVLGGELLSLVS